MISEITCLIKENPLIHLYLAAVFVDIVLGNIKAWTTSDVDSSVGLRGSIKHFGVMTFVMVLLPAVTAFTETDVLAYGIITYLIYQYMISIVENLSKLGFPMPEFIVESFRRLHEDQLPDMTHSVKIQIDERDEDYYD